MAQLFEIMSPACAQPTVMSVLRNWGCVPYNGKGHSVL